MTKNIDPQLLDSFVYLGEYVYLKFMCTQFLHDESTKVPKYTHTHTYIYTPNNINLR